MKGNTNAQKTADYASSIRLSATQFQTQIADRTSSVLDLPSTYPFNTERYKLVQEGAVGNR